MNTWSPLASAFNAKPNKLLSLHFTKGATVSRVVWGLILLFAVNFLGGTGLCYVVHGMGLFLGRVLGDRVVLWGSGSGVTRACLLYQLAGYQIIIIIIISVFTCVGLDFVSHLKLDHE